jgi:uncharacterized LabA/DUF88 family protein
VRPEGEADDVAMQRSRRQQLANDPEARVMVFVDGQYLYKECGRVFHHPHCHPHVLAAELAGPRKLVGTRFYTGLHDPRKNPDGHAALSRRLQAMQANSVTYQTRTLQYVWEWGPSLEVRRRLPRAGPSEDPRTVEIAPYERAMEKGVDLFLALDAIDLAMTGKYDVAIIVSLDMDLTELPPMLRRFVRYVGLPDVRVEAAVIKRPSPRRPTRPPRRVLPNFDYTHPITEDMFQRAIDLVDYTKPAHEDRDV